MKRSRLRLLQGCNTVITVASSKDAIFPRKTRFCCIVASFLAKAAQAHGMHIIAARLSGYRCGE
jgi:hypothetical protein